MLTSQCVTARTFGIIRVELDAGIWHKQLAAASYQRNNINIAHDNHSQLKFQLIEIMW
jgi:hypothetical protein